MTGVSLEQPQGLQGLFELPARLVAVDRGGDDVEGAQVAPGRRGFEPLAMALFEADVAHDRRDGGRAQVLADGLHALTKVLGAGNLVGEVEESEGGLGLAHGDPEATRR